MFGIDDAALALMLAGAIGTAGSLYTNKKNRDAQADANAINWEIARQNNATQIEMANTAHQREVRDLRAAGLNPILSAGGRGAATPSLQSPTIDPVHQDSPFEGLANSAKGLGRYFSQEYKNQVESQILDNTYQGLINADQNLQNEINLKTADSQADSLSADKIRGVIDKSAMMAETGIGLERNSDGTLKPVILDDDKAHKALDLAREGIRSDLKLRANQNWRANLSSFVPFVSPAAVNSAASAIRGPAAYRNRKP